MFSEAVTLASLELQIKSGNIQKELYWARGCLKDQMKSILPAAYAKDKTIERDILNAWRALQGTSELMAKVRYVNLCRSLKNFGVVTFAVRELDPRGKKTPLILGFTTEHILRISQETKEVVKSYNFFKLRSWSVSRDSLVLGACGVASVMTDGRVLTPCFSGIDRL
jgi:talin